MKQLMIAMLAIVSIMSAANSAFAERSWKNVEYMNHEQTEINKLQQQINDLNLALNQKTEDKAASEKFREKVFVISLPVWAGSGLGLGALVLSENKGLSFKGIGRVQQAALLISVVAGVGITAAEASHVKVWLDEKSIKQINQDLIDAQSNLETRKSTLEFLKNSELDESN